MSSQCYQGHTCTHQHDTDNAAPILGEEIAIQVTHQAAIRATKSCDWELTIGLSI